MLATVGLAGFVGACALPPKDDPDALAQYEAANDPFEPANRMIFAVNSAVDTLVLQPAAVTYRDLAPDELKTPFENVLVNLMMPISIINALLQGDMERADMAAQRFAGGVATLMLGNTQPNKAPVHEDAGQTLGVWGVGSGPYIMLPLLGPSNARDTTGTIVDFFMDPVGYIARPELSIARGASKAVVDRSKNIDAVRDLQRNSLDYYASVRSLYRQRRAAQIDNGSTGGQETSPTIGFEQDLDSPVLESDAGSNGSVKTDKMSRN
jgi:phospholipid-binding lipoprotein MlaA